MSLFLVFIAGVATGFLLTALGIGFALGLIGDTMERRDQ